MLKSIHVKKSGNAWIAAMLGKAYSSAICWRYSNGVRPYSR